MTCFPPVGFLPELSLTVWWILLISSLLLATGHLASMLSTEWGDRGTGPKSLLFSVMFHAALLGGLFVLKPTLDRMLGEPGESPDQQTRRFQVGSIRLDAAETPAADRVPEAWRSDQPRDLQALSRSDVPRDPLEAIRRDREPNRTPLDLPTPDLETTDRTYGDAAPNRPDAAPEPLASVTTPRATIPDVSPRFEAPETPTDPQPQRLARSDLEVSDDPFSLPTRRTPISASPLTTDMNLTERADDPSVAPRRRDEEGPRPSQSAPPAGPTPGGIAAAPIAPSLPLTEAPVEPNPERPVRSFDPTDVPLAMADPRRTRTPLPTDAVDPLAGAGLSERRTDVAPRPDRADDDGPSVVVTESSEPSSAPGVPDAYRLRDLAQRSEMAKRYGGTAESEAAVEAALAWFARTQESAGYWDGSKYGAGSGPDDDPLIEPDADKRNTGREADAGLTGLVTLTFLGAGYTRTGGRYASSVDRAVRWLIARQKEDGSLAGDANYFARMYSHGIATYALAEALALEGDRADPALRRAVRRAVAYIVEQQYPDGGWRYSQRFRTGDMSMFGWQCMALKSAANAGAPTPADTHSRMINFLRARSETVDAEGRLVPYQYGGLARYMQEEGYAVKPSMTAEALFCKQILGLRRDQPAAREAVGFINRHPPDLKSWNLYYWYYASLALHEHGGPAWENWNGRLRDLLLEEQYTQGPNAGTWPLRPNQNNYTEYGGQLYATALATLCLEVYYRFSPADGGAAAMDGRPDERADR